VLGHDPDHIADPRIVLVTHISHAGSRDVQCAACGTRGRARSGPRWPSPAREVRDVPTAVLEWPLLRQELNPLGSLPAVKGNTLITP
jgi:hypothetical protein